MAKIKPHLITDLMNVCIYHCDVQGVTYVHQDTVAAAGRRLCGRQQQQGAGRGRGLCWVR